MAQAAQKPEPFKGGKLAEKLNDWMQFLQDFYRAGINMSETNTPTGRAFNAFAGSSQSAPISYLFQMLNASVPITHPGRIQVRAGSICNIWPTGMTPGDPAGDEFYLDLAEGQNTIYVGLVVNSDGTFGAATCSIVEPTNPMVAWFEVGLATSTSGVVSGIVNIAKGAQTGIIEFSADGTSVQGFFWSAGVA